MDFLDLAIDRVQPRTRLARRPFSLLGALVYLRLELLYEGRDPAADRDLGSARVPDHAMQFQSRLGYV